MNAIIVNTNQDNALEIIEVTVSIEIPVTFKGEFEMETEIQRHVMATNEAGDIVWAQDMGDEFMFVRPATEEEIVFVELATRLDRSTFSLGLPFAAELPF